MSIGLFACSSGRLKAEVLKNNGGKPIVLSSEEHQRLNEMRKKIDPDDLKPGPSKTFTKSVTRGEGSFNIELLKPENIFKLLLGQSDVTLFTYDLPELAFEFTYRHCRPSTFSTRSRSQLHAFSLRKPFLSEFVPIDTLRTVRIHQGCFRETPEPAENWEHWWALFFDDGS